MSKRAINVAVGMAFLLVGSGFSVGQHINSDPNVRGNAQPQGTLTVTLTIASSVGVVTGADGWQRIVVANAAAASDNVSSVHYVRLNDVDALNRADSPPVVSSPIMNSVRKTPRK